MARIFLLNKPMHMLSQFRDDAGRSTLADVIDVPGVYPAGRLDYDSEGLLLLTDNGALQARIASPDRKMPKTYWVQVEGEPNFEALEKLSSGILLKDGMTKPAGIRLMEEPTLWPRNPPVRKRLNQPTSWLSVTLTEGRNRQVRRMTAAVGHPTLRLVRAQIGHWTLEHLAPGEWREETVHLPQKPRVGNRKPGQPSRKRRRP